jgi:uncharacterized protein YjbI with pentapeptide repeats
MKISQEELNDILDKHEKYLSDLPEGKYADLSNMDLSDLDLSYMNLSYANLNSTSLNNSKLNYADLNNAKLSNANLSKANLSYAILSNTKLSYSYLNNTNLSNTDLSKANLYEIKEDLFKVLDNAKPEVLGLYKALIEGRIEGAIYKGECACLIGTIANIRKVDVSTLKRNPYSLIECWSIGIKIGDIPKTNQISNITKIWIEEFAKTNDIKLD